MGQVALMLLSHPWPYLAQNCRWMPKICLFSIVAAGWGACCHKANDSQLHNNTYCHHEPIHVSLLPWGSNTTNFAPLWVRHLHAGGGLCGRYSPYLGHVAVLHGRTDSWACCPHNGAPPAAPDGSQRLHTNLGDLGSPNRIGGCSLTQGVIYHRQWWQMVARGQGLACEKAPQESDLHKWRQRPEHPTPTTRNDSGAVHPIISLLLFLYYFYLFICARSGPLQAKFYILRNKFQTRAGLILRRGV